MYELQYLKDAKLWYLGKSKIVENVFETENIFVHVNVWKNVIKISHVFIEFLAPIKCKATFLLWRNNFTVKIYVQYLNNPSMF